MPELAVIMIVKNEADCLAQCLQSVRQIADQIVIADTGSTDGTPEIARAFGAQVFDTAWQNDFAAARNIALAAAKADWLLHMDADEVLDSAGAQTVRALVDADGPADAYEITLANYCNDMRAWRWRPAAASDPMARGFAGYIPVPLLRLFRNNRGFHYREPVHENITESVIELGGQVASAQAVIHHYGYACEPEKARVKATLYHQIARKKVAERTADPKAWLDLAEQAFAVGEQIEAEAAARQAVALAPGDLAAATSLANMLLIRGELDQGRTLLQPFAGPDAPAHVLVALGAIAYRQGRINDAQLTLEQAVAAHPWAVQAKVALARVRDIQLRHDEARDLLACAAQTAPSLAELQNLVRAHDARVQADKALENKQLAQALRLLRDAIALDPEDPLTHWTIAKTLRLAGQVQQACQSETRATRLCAFLE